MNQKLISPLLLFLLFFFMGCSNSYKPIKPENKYFKKSIKNVFPSDLKNNPHKYENKLIHMVGIIREKSIIKNQQGNPFLVLKIEQHYYDYILDYGAQNETMFISPKSNGVIIGFRALKPDVDLNEVKEYYNKIADIQNLVFIYGYLIDISEGTPRLDLSFIRYIDESEYATNIFSYEVKRDFDGIVLLDENKLPALDNFEVIKYAKEGRNQTKEEK